MMCLYTVIQLIRPLSLLFSGQYIPTTPRRFHLETHQQLSYNRYSFCLFDVLPLFFFPLFSLILSLFTFLSSFSVLSSKGCKWCLIPVENITQLDKTMNGAALEKEFGGLSANGIFKKEGWVTPSTNAPQAPTTDKKIPTRTTELMEKWKTNKARKREDKNDSSADGQQPSTSQHTAKKPRGLDPDDANDISKTKSAEN